MSALFAQTSLLWHTQAKAACLNSIQQREKEGKKIQRTFIMPVWLAANGRLKGCCHGHVRTRCAMSSPLLRRNRNELAATRDDQRAVIPILNAVHERAADIAQVALEALDIRESNRETRLRTCEESQLV